MTFPIDGSPFTVDSLRNLGDAAAVACLCAAAARRTGKWLGGLEWSVWRTC